MNVAAFIVTLYPTPVRRRWGTELQDQIAQAGPRSWSDAILAAATLWLHPALWPETKPGEKRHLMATFAVAITVVTSLTMRATGPQGPGGGSRILGPAWMVLVLLGMLAAAPIPRLNMAALGRLASVTARTLTLPLVAGAAIILLANSQLVDHAKGAAHAALVTSYWLMLIFAGERACALVGKTADFADPPGHRRIRLALTLIGAGLSLAAAQTIVALWRASDDVSGFIAASALIALVAALITTGRDLRATA